MTEPAWLLAPDPAQVAADLTGRFTSAHGVAPDGVWSAPGRVNLIGEHTDYNEGLCLPLALAHRTYAAVRVRADSGFSLASVQAGEGWSGTLDEVGPGRPGGWSAYVAGVLWSLQRKGIRVPGLDIVIDGRVPLGSGLSSSAALECAVAVAVADVAPLGSTLSRRDLMAASIEAENVVAGANTGGMDQAVSLLARTGHALLLDCADFSTRDVPWRIGDLGWTLLVVDTRAPHALVDGQYAERRASTEEAARRLGVRSLRRVAVDDLDETLARLDDAVLRRRTRHVVTEIARVRDAAEALERGDVQGLGAAMTASHASLRDDYEVTVPELDTVVQVALGAGAAGARMTGGGFGGSAIALVGDAAYEQVAEAVAAAFADRGFAAPQFLLATPSAPAGRTT
ncbi:MAG: galactokinase [Nostocoides sp.]